MKKWFMSFIILVGFISIASTSHATPVEYVKACSVFGSGFFYLPGTDTCFNPTTGVTKQPTENGYWASAVPSPGNWVESERAECQDGRVFKVGTFSSDDFTLNSHNKYETVHVLLRLGSNEFISKVMMSGGFAKSNFCLSFYEPAVKPNLQEAYQTMGCVNPGILSGQPAVFSFTPLWSVPPSIFTTRPIRLVGNSGMDNWGAPPNVNTGAPPPFEGAISCWVCIQKAYRRY
jgi:hypothetical protein